MLIVEKTRQKIGVLLCQVGTPNSPTPGDLFPYLKNFLSDPRVIDYHPMLWKIILRVFVLPKRSVSSAKLYGKIWTAKGSPLLVYSKRQVIGLQERLGSDYQVELGMAYGGPSIPEALARLEQNGVQRIVVVPLFPQFSTATTASVFDAVYSAASGRKWDSWRIQKKFIPSLRFVEPYYNHPRYIDALAGCTKRGLEHVAHKPDAFIVTFHGVPKRYTDEGDPYFEHCQTTARLLAEAMGWKSEQWTLAFQSRFGREEWLGPYTDRVIASLPSQGITRPCIVAPAFVTDCLETLHELGIEGREIFLAHGGEREFYSLLPCLNDTPEWLDFLTQLVHTNSLGWNN